MINMEFYNFKALRSAMQPVLELKKWRENKNARSRVPLCILWLTLAILGFIFTRGCEQVAHAYSFPSKVKLNDEIAIKAIVGEAADQGFKGMILCGEVIRHRKSLEGLYGLNSYHVAHEPKWVWNMAKKAWYASKNTNYTHVANHFENIKAFGVPYWAKNCKEIMKYKDIVFYKEI